MVRTKYSHLTNGELANQAEFAAGKSELIRELVKRILPGQHAVPAAHVGQASNTCPVCEAGLKIKFNSVEAA